VSLHQRNSQIWSDLIASSVQENFCLVFSIASSVTKILANKIVSLYSIFFSKIWYLYRFKRYIFEYRCPPLPVWQRWGEEAAGEALEDTQGHRQYHVISLHNCPCPRLTALCPIRAGLKNLVQLGDKTRRVLFSFLTGPVFCL
jgi:hypothetical protein